MKRVSLVAVLALLICALPASADCGAFVQRQVIVSPVVAPVAQFQLVQPFVATQTVVTPVVQQVVAQPIVAAQFVQPVVIRQRVRSKVIVQPVVRRRGLFLRF